MVAKPVWSVVREILTADLSLTADEVITKAKAKGVKAPDAAIRGTVYNVRKKLKKKVAAPAAKPAPVAARTTTAPTTSSVVRDILSGDLGLSADEVVAAAKARGLMASEASIKALVYNIRGELKKKAMPAPRVVPAAAQKTTPPTPAADTPGVAQVLSNVAQVHAAVLASGGVEQAKQVAEAVRACGGPEAFAQYLDLVAGIRTN
ncbi:MAG: hypothetical protein U0804_12570 [Gemmataceae bacterium]